MNQIVGCKKTEYIQETGSSSCIKIALFRLHHETASYMSCDNIDYWFFTRCPQSAEFFIISIE